MKKIITLLFCVAATAFAANADEALIQRCINVVLGNEASTTLMASNLDVNNDGTIDVGDVTMLIQMQIDERNANIKKAPAKDNDVNKLINEVLETTSGTPNVQDVNQAIEKNLPQKK